MVDNSPYRFIFELSEGDPHADEDQLFVYWFPFLDEIAKVKEMSIDSTGAFQGRTEELEEEYGVHDFATSGEYELIGFHSYEVEPGRSMELLQKWRQFFIEQGVSVGEITRMRQSEYEQQL